jgi:hypothetical protein
MAIHYLFDVDATCTRDAMVMRLFGNQAKHWAQIVDTPHILSRKCLES